MDELESQEFTLEDIMAEFGDNQEPLSPEEEQLISEEISETDVEEIISEVTETVEEPEETEPEAETAPEVTSDTIRMDVIDIPETPAVITADTIRMEPVTEETEAPEQVTSGDTIRMDEEALAAIHAATRQEETPEETPEEEFTEQWEPEYEQPMGEYVPPQPIIFHPQSRLRELKRKLVAGPEKRYYELSEVGFGKLQLAIGSCLLLVLVSVAISVLYATGYVPQERMRLMVFAQLFLMLTAALIGSFQLIEGVEDLFHKRFSLNTLLVVTFIACVVDAACCFKTLRVPCCAAFSLEMFMSLWSAYHKRSTEMGMMDTMRKATRLDKLGVAEAYMDGQNGLLRGEAQVEDFMDHYKAPSAPEKTLNKYALFAMLGCMVVAGIAGVKGGLYDGIMVLAVSLLAAVPASAFVALTRPWAVLERQMHKLGAVLCGWRGVEGLRGKMLFPVDHTDLFPAGSAKMNGVKFFGTREPDEIVAYCTALVNADGGSLAPLFEHVLASRNGRHYDVQYFRTYPGGIGGEVQGEPVLVGMLPFLRDMGVEVPEGIRVNQAVCVAIDGELCGLFAVTFDKNKQAALGLSALCSTRKLKAVLTNNDFILTESFLRAKFGINPKRIQIPEHAVCSLLQEQKLPEDAPALVVSTKPGVAPFAIGALGAKALRTASILGVVIHMLGGILGLATMAVLTLLGRTDLLTPMNMFLYQLVWLVPGLLVTHWTKIF